MTTRLELDRRHLAAGRRAGVPPGDGGRWRVVIAVPLIALSALLAFGAQADAGTPTGARSSDGPPPPGASWFALPVAFYMPETRLGFGSIGGVHFSFEPALPTSDVQLIAVGTVREQAILDLHAQLFFSQAFAASAAVKAALFPDLFYGIGDDAPASARETYTSRSLAVRVNPEWYLVPSLRTGPRLSLRVERITDLEPGGRLVAGGMAGADGYTSTALGWSVTYDTRDNRFAPRTGRSVEAWYELATGGTGGGSRYGRGALDARQFLAFGRSVVLGTAVHLEATHGEVPFTLLPRVGGDQHLRGYYEGRWRDRLMYAAQTELRFPIAGRLGGAVFAGVSDVAARPDGFRTRTIRPAAGAGARFRLTSDGLNARLDVGAGQEGANLYFNLGEAF